jgi:hypothetical protein
MSAEFFLGATQYQIVEASDAGTLADKVDVELSVGGWYLYGNPFCVAPGPDQYLIWSQALVRVD